MNYLTPEKIEQVNQLLTSGYGTRATARMAGVARGTVERYREKLGLTSGNCGCGKPYTHRGWCQFRFAQSENRQKFMAEWVGWKPRSLDDIYWTLKGLPESLDDDCYLGSPPLTTAER